LQEAASSLEYIWLTEVARLIPELLVERLDLPAPGPLKESWQRQRMFEAMTRYILAGKQPLLLHIDDLQWCDQETLEWLHFLVRFDRRAQLLVVGTVRSEEFGPDHALNSLLLALRHSRQLFEIDLKPLNPTETATLATHVAGRDLGSDLLAKMYQETEGNPLFVVETVRSGLPGGDTDEIHKSPSLPPTVQTVITSRLARLSSEARELVELAAVIGRAFDFDVLAQASEIDEETLVRRLDELWQRRIVREQGADAYDFSHDKIREAAYASMSQARRRLQHRRVAQALEFIHASHLETVSGRIAVHYEQAGQWEQAIPFYRRAVQAAQHVYANEEAIQYLKRALAPFDRALPADEEGEWRVVIAELHEHLGDILHLTGRHDAARRAYQHALSHAPEDDRLWLSGLHRKEGNTWRSENRYEDAFLAYQAAESVLGKATDALASEWWQEWLQIRLERIWVHYWLNQWKKIAELIEDVREVVERYATPNQHINFLVSSGSVNMRKNRYAIEAETISLCQAALAISQKMNDAGETAWIRFVLGFGLLWRGELIRAEKQMLLALETAERTGDVVHQSRCLTYLTILYRKQGQVAEVQRYLSLALQAARTAMMPEYIGTAEANLSWVAWREGDLEGARKHGRSALASWQKLPKGHASCAFQWTALWPLIGVALTRDEDAMAVSYARVLLESSQQRLPDALAAELEDVVHTWDAMKPETTRAQLERAITLAQKMDYL
jgi:tetratricopeptide (TPR) repeat protein